MLYFRARKGVSVMAKMKIKQSAIRNLERDIKKQAVELAEKELRRKGMDIKCPSCGAAVRFKLGGKCPECGCLFPDHVTNDS